MTRSRISPKATSAWPRSSAINGCVAAFALLLGASAAHAQVPAPPAKRGTVRTDTLWAQSLGINKALTVYLPPSYATNRSKRYPVLYYLHGLGGSERNWVDNAHLDHTLDSLIAAGQPEAIVVMPDGDDSWYTTWGSLPDLAACRADSTRKERESTFCVPWPHYDDYIAFDIVQHVDRHYRTRADRAHRAIGGLSMGGYGAVTIALSYPNEFAAAASHSGVLSPRLMAGGGYAKTEPEFRAAAKNLWRSMGNAFGRDTIGWNMREPTKIAQRLLTNASAKGLMPALLIDCGVDDPYLAQNRDFHQTLLRLGVSHQYAEWPGAHTWTYWSSHSVESLRFLLAAVATP